MKRGVEAFGMSLVMAMAAAPAIAGTPIHVPEPASMSLLAVGMGGAYVARKFFRRK